jgi:zinc protease
MLDRTTAPAYHPIQSNKIPSIDTEILSNEIPVYSAGFANQDVVKLELVFNAGSAFESKGGVSSLFSKMLLGGTSRSNSSDLMAGFDQYGGFIEITSSVERLNIVLFGLQKFFDKYLALISEIIGESIFPEAELEIQRKIALQNLLLNQEKSTFLASQNFKRLLFGSEHPYGKILERNQLESITRNDLIEFYEENIQGKAFQVFLSGKIGQKQKAQLNDCFGKDTYEFKSEFDFQFETLPVSSFLVSMPDKMQSTIRLGKPLFNRKHPDVFKMMVCNTAFGGYFGSRLMKNIREEKGYTYGISSNMTPLKNFGYFLIGADVVKENTVDALNQIGIEIENIQNTRLTEDEIENVKNYLCGSYAGSITTAFDVMDKHRSRILSELPLNYYDNFIDQINAVSSDDIQKMAQKYLSMESMSEVIVGERI